MPPPSRTISGPRLLKIRAVAAHTSRTTVPPGATHAVLSPATLEHFHGSREIYFREPPESGAPVELFAERYRGGADPWRVHSCWYERRKRDRAQLQARLRGEETPGP